MLSIVYKGTKNSPKLREFRGIFVLNHVKMTVNIKKFFALRAKSA